MKHRFTDKKSSKTYTFLGIGDSRWVDKIIGYDNSGIVKSFDYELVTFLIEPPKE